MTTREKELESRVATLERQLSRIYEQLGIRDEELRKIEYKDAIEAAVAGDRGPLNAYLKKVNGERKPAA